MSSWRSRVYLTDGLDANLTQSCTKVIDEGPAHLARETRNIAHILKPRIVTLSSWICFPFHDPFPCSQPDTTIFAPRSQQRKPIIPTTQCPFLDTSAQDPSTLLYRPPQPLLHPRNRLMITRIRRQLHHKIHGLLIQPHEIPLEPQITDPRLILLAPAPVILEEERKRPRRVEQRALDGYLLHVVRLRDLERLRGRLVGRGGEVEGVVVEEEFEGLGGGGRGRGAEEDAVEADSAGEEDDHEELLVGEALQFGSGVEALGPGFLDDAAALVGFIFVEGAQPGEVDLLVEEVLERGNDVVVVVMDMVVSFGVLLVVVVMVVVVMGHGCDGGVAG